MQPNERQQEAADKLVQLLDLAPAGKEEVLQPNLTPNPMLEVLSLLIVSMQLHFKVIKQWNGSTVNNYLYLADFF